MNAVDDEAADVVREDDTLEDVREGLDGQLAILVDELLGRLGLGGGFVRRLAVALSRRILGRCLSLLTLRRFLLAVLDGGRVESLDVLAVIVLVVGVVLEELGQAELFSHAEAQVPYRLGGGADALVDVELGNLVLGRQLQRRLRRERVRRPCDQYARGIVGGNVEVELGVFGLGRFAFSAFSAFSVALGSLSRSLGLSSFRGLSFLSLGFRDGVTVLVELGFGVLGGGGGGGSLLLSLSRLISLHHFSPLLFSRERGDARGQ